MMSSAYKLLFVQLTELEKQVKGNSEMITEVVDMVGRLTEVVDKMSKELAKMKGMSPIPIPDDRLPPAVEQALDRLGC